MPKKLGVPAILSRLTKKTLPICTMKTIFSLILFCAIGTMSVAGAHTVGEIEIGGVLPDTQMRGLSGASKKLSVFRGKPLVINVWASWCGPCREEMSSLDRLARRAGGKQFNVIGISTDDYRNLATAFLKESKTSFTHFIDHDVVLENLLGADRIPLTLLVDAQGRVLAKYYGANEWDSPESVEIIEKAFHIKM